MKKLWQKDWQLHTVLETFETGDDLVLDQKLIEYDVYGSLAHANMLKEIGLLSEDELNQTRSGLREVLKEVKHGRFRLQPGDEDMHTKIENYLTEHVGDVGKKIHTGRSRNDQVLTALRLYTKESLLAIWNSQLQMVETLVMFAKAHEFVPMPGYTHMQKAMPASIGMWAGAHAESLLDSISVLRTAFQLNDQSPLGSAAGYGVPLPLDREKTAQLLGFAKVQNNSLYCQNSRGKLELVVLTSLHQILLDLSRLASDVLLFTTSEFSFFQVADTVATGSSIMPQKKNIDVAELIRSKSAVALGWYTHVASIVNHLPSGYNRDLQDTKKTMIEAFETTGKTLAAAQILMNNVTPNTEHLAAAMTPELFATHEAYALVEQGVPFRDAYQQAAKKVAHLTMPNIEKALRQAKHTGATGNVGLGNLEKKVQKERQRLRKEQKEFGHVLERLVDV